ncbi:MAG: MFS transporter [Acidobacteriota bacterium]
MTVDPTASRRRLILALTPGLIAFSMGQTVLFAIAGPAFREIGLGEAQLGVIISAAALVFVLASGVWGQIADRWGRRPTILFGLLAYTLISLAFAGVLQAGLGQALTPSLVFGLLLFLRMLYAGLGAGVQPASIALMADSSTAAERSSAVAVVGAAFSVGMVLGPATAAALVGFGLLAPLYAIAGLALLGVLLAALLLSSNEHRPAETAIEGSTQRSGFALLLAGALLLYVAMSSVQQTLAFNLQDLLGADGETTARLTGFCFMCIALGTLTMQGVVIQRLRPSAPRLLFFGLPTILLALATYATASGFPQLLLASLFIGFGFGLTTPGLMAAASLLAGAQEQGKIAGLVQATMAGGFIVGPITATYLYQIDRRYAGLLALAATVLALLSIFAWLRRARSNPLPNAAAP